MTSAPPAHDAAGRVNGALLPTFSVAVPVIVVAPVIATLLLRRPAAEVGQVQGCAGDAIDNEGNWYTPGVKAG